jgi:uncharacterized protein (DUF2252 family)
VFPRSALGDFTLDPARPHPLALLRSQDDSRISELIPIRYGRMLASPFAFFRGAALVMAADLAAGPRSDLTAQLCGDAHVSNFGVFGSPERNLVFDINDFDETLPGPWEWDVKRLMASLAIAARGNGFRDADRGDIVRTSARAYRERMRELAALGELDVWYSHTAIDAVTEGSVDPKFAETIRRGAEIARSRDSLQASSKLTTVVDGRRRLISDPPLLIPIEELVGAKDAQRHEQHMGKLFEDYRASLDQSLASLVSRFRYAGMARKVVGVGSVGARAFIVLLQGRDENDPLFLQVKEARASVLEDHLPKSRYKQPGERVVKGQRLMQAASDIYLGWTVGFDTTRHFYWRQLRDMKGSVDVEGMLPAGLSTYASICSWTLARAHARSGDPVAIAAYLGSSDKFDRSITDFSERYADQNERDYQAFMSAITSGRLQATEGI